MLAAGAKQLGAGVGSVPAWRVTCVAHFGRLHHSWQRVVGTEAAYLSLRTRAVMETSAPKDCDCH